MDYHIAPFAQVWGNGIFNVPNDVADRYLKIASEYQIKALLFILRNGGKSTSAEIAKALGQTSGDIDELMEFWTEEGVLSSEKDSQGEHYAAPSEQTPPQEKEKARTVRETLPPPRLAPKDIVSAQRQSKEIAFLLNEAQVILGRTISHSEQEMLVNMVNYYGLKVEIIMMILEFYRSEKEKGRAINLSYVNAMAKNWADEGIETISQAEEKLSSIARSDRLWNEIISITGVRHRRPTAKQREMLERWFADFDISMITLAADIMKENIPEPKLTYMDSIIKKWKKAGIKSPSQVQAQQEAFEKSKADKKSDRLTAPPTYNLEKVKRDVMDNTDI